MTDLAFYWVQIDRLDAPGSRFEALHHLYGLFLDWGSPDASTERWLSCDEEEMRRLAEAAFWGLRNAGLTEIVASRSLEKLYNLLGILSWLLSTDTINLDLKPIYSEVAGRLRSLYGVRVSSVLPLYRNQPVGYVLDGLSTRDVMSPDPI